MAAASQMEGRMTSRISTLAIGVRARLGGVLLIVVSAVVIACNNGGGSGY